MAKAREWLREKSIVKQIISEANVIFNVLDGRIPFETRNKFIEDTVKKQNKKLYFIVNKVDLIPKDFAEKVKKELSKEFPTILYSASKKIGERELNRLLKNFSKERKIFKIGVVGYPNVGKSSLINSLKRRKVSTVSPKPGMTRGKQLVKMYPNVFLIDTPGIITLETDEDLILKGSYLPEKLEYPIEATIKFLDKILNVKPDVLKTTYGVETEGKDSYQVLKEIGNKLNYKLAGGEIDLDRTAKKILWDWLKGKLNPYWI